MPTPAATPRPDGAMAADDDAVERYLTHVRVERRLADRTVTLYRIDLQRLQALAREAGVALEAVGNPQVRHWVARLHAQGRSPRGIAMALSAWRGFYRWLGREGRIAANPVSDVRAPRAARPLPKALSVDDAVRLAEFHDTQADPWVEARDVAIVELLYGAGLRVGELIGLDVLATTASRGWLDLAAGEAHVLGKGSKRRTVPIGTRAAQAVERWLALRAAGPGAQQAALFVGRRGERLSAQSVWLRLRHRSRQAELPAPVHPHMLRHSFASHVLQSSGDLRAVQELLGHANIGTTQVYTRLDFQHLAKAYDAAHPRARARKP